MNNQTKGVVITAIGVLAIVPDSLLVRLIDAPHMTVIFWRAAFSAATILLGVSLYYRAATWRVLTGLGAMGLAYAVLLSIATVLFILAIQLTTIASALFIVSTTSVFAALLSWLFLHERLSQRMVWTIVLSMAGVAIIAHDKTGSSDTALLGDLCAIGAALSMAASFTVARATRHISMVPAGGISYLIVTLATLPFAAPETMQAMDWTYALVLGCVFVPLGTSLLALGPRYITSAEVSLLILLEAILAPLLAWIVLNEFPGNQTLLGGAVVLGVLAISNLVALRRSTARKPV